jgi:TatA/E family protein of Tat protein translocase
MFGLGFWEIVVIAVVALLFIGPDRLPRFFRALGRATREFQRASRELRENLSIDEPPPRRPPPARRPVQGVSAEVATPHPPSRSIVLPPKTPDPWPDAPPIKAESKPAEPFDEPPAPPPGPPPPPVSLSVPEPVPPPGPPPPAVPISLPEPVTTAPLPPPIMPRTAAPGGEKPSNATTTNTTAKPAKSGGEG